MFLRAVVLAVVLITAAPTSARADELRGHAGPVKQERHRVEVILHAGHALWTAERRLSSRVNNEAVLSIALPHALGSPDQRAVPVALSLKQGGAWMEGPLLDPVTALETHLAGGGEDDASALLSMTGLDMAELLVAGVGPRAPQSVRYSLRVPTQYAAGRHALRVPPSDAKLGATISARTEGGTLLVDGRRWPQGIAIDYDPSAGVELALRPEAAPQVDGELVVIPFGANVLTRARVSVTSHLSDAPRRPYVVLALDASRSFAGERLDAQFAAARAYLGHLPDAQVEVITFHRHASARHGQFVSSAQARSDLRSWRPTLANGSEPQTALTLATELLRAVPESSPKRIVLLSDGQLRSDHGTDTLQDALEPKLALTHLVKLEGQGDPILSRDDVDSGWSRAARATGGLAWSASGSSASGHWNAMTRVFEHLVRPMTLDDVTLVSAAWMDEPTWSFPSQLGEGEGFTLLGTFAKPMPWLELRAKAWNETVRVSFGARDDDGVWSALVFGDGSFPPGATDAGELRALAHRAGAVTSWTSYLVGQTRLPPPQSADGGYGTGQGFSSGCGCGVSGRHPGDRKAWLEEKLRHAWYRCGGALHAARIDLETVRGEVVAVGPATVSAAAAPEMGTCLREATWGLELDTMFVDDELTSHAIEAPPMSSLSRTRGMSQPHSAPRSRVALRSDP